MRSAPDAEPHDLTPEAAVCSESPAAEPTWRRLLLPSWATRRRMLRREAWILILASYPAILFAYAWPPDFRNTAPAYVVAAWAAFMVRTFLFHAGLVYLLIAAAALVVKQRRLAVAAAPLVLISLGPTLSEFGPRRPPPVTGEAITVMSVNLLSVNRDTAPIVAEIAAAGPDVLLLQEYSEHWHDALQDAIGSTYPHIAYVIRDDSFGTAIYSRRAFLEPPEMDVRLGSGTEPQVRAVIAVSDRPVAFYNVHPLPPRSLEYVTEARLQIADLADMLRQETLPAVVAGDFNFTQNSDQFSLLRRVGLTETHEIAGQGRGATWPVHSIFRYVPGLRLDRIFLSKELTAAESRTGAGVGSDHRPVIARIGLRR